MFKSSFFHELYFFIDLEKIKNNRGVDESSRNETRFADLGELEQPFQNDAVDLSASIHPPSFCKYLYIICVDYIIHNFIVYYLLNVLFPLLMYFLSALKSLVGSMFSLKANNVAIVTNNFQYNALTTVLNSAHLTYAYMIQFHCHFYPLISYVCLIE